MVIAKDSASPSYREEITMTSRRLRMRDAINLKRMGEKIVTLEARSKTVACVALAALTLSALSLVLQFIL